MSNKTRILSRELAFLERLDEAAGPETQYVALAGESVSDTGDSLSAPHLITRCLLEAVGGVTYDPQGRAVPVPAPRSSSDDRAARRALGRIRGVLRRAREYGVEFVCCYHV